MKLPPPTMVGGSIYKSTWGYYKISNANMEWTLPHHDGGGNLIYWPPVIKENLELFLKKSITYSENRFFEDHLNIWNTMFGGEFMCFFGKRKLTWREFFLRLGRRYLTTIREPLSHVASMYKHCTESKHQCSECMNSSIHKTPFRAWVHYWHFFKSFYQASITVHLFNLQRLLVECQFHSSFH